MDAKRLSLRRKGVLKWWHHSNFNRLSLYEHCRSFSRQESTEKKGTGSFATGTLTVKYLRPTPMDHPVILRARVTDMKEKKVIVTCSLFSGEVECARGEVIAVRIPEGYWKE